MDVSAFCILEVNSIYNQIIGLNSGTKIVNVHHVYDDEHDCDIDIDVFGQKLMFLYLFLCMMLLLNENL